jgi:hypothetical protein
MKKIQYLPWAGLLIFLSLILGLTNQALALSYGFYNITNNNAGDAAIGVAQLSVDVIDVGSGQVSFKFTNKGTAASSITGIYFDDGTLLGIASIASSAGVSFSAVEKSDNFPGGNTVNFVTTKGFSADSDPPVQPMGVNPGEFVTITFNLLTGMAYADVINALALGNNTSGTNEDDQDPYDGMLRIGVHVQGFASGGSESFINGPNPVPEPATLLLMGLGSGVMGAGIRRLRRKTKKS